MLKSALELAGIEFSEADQARLLSMIDSNLASYERVRELNIAAEIPPPFYFNPLVPGMKVNRQSQLFHPSVPSVKRPSQLDEIAFAPLVVLAEWIRTRQVTSVELTELYLRRLDRYGGEAELNCVVTVLEERALMQARAADREIAEGRYRGSLHGIPWGVKDLFAVGGYRTTWGSALFQDRVLDYDASVVEMLDRAGAVLIAKLSTSELAGGDDIWFGGQTRNPWDINTGAGGSSSGSAAAVAAGLVGFALGTETDGSILSPAALCGVTGLRPTFGRISRYGVMPLQWTTDRVGPLCRCAEDCALVMKEIARPDGRDLSVSDVPFGWDAQRDVRTLKVGYLARAFDEVIESAARRRNDRLLEQMQSLGVQLIPIDVPNFLSDLPALRSESAAIFDELIRSGRDAQLGDRNRVDFMRSMRTVPAVEYLQAQRARMMLMMQLAEATRDVDVYFGPTGVDSKASAAGQGCRGESVAQRHGIAANLATYPALAVPCGFTDSGMPQSVTFFARPFGETELLTFAKAYQDAMNFQSRRPPLPNGSP